MSFFERPDPRLIQSADPSPLGATAAALRRHAIALAVCLLAVAGAYAASVETGLREVAATGGFIAVHGLYAPVTIVRDRRDVPHIRASNAHDAYFAEGYVQGSDRWFQLDLTRRYAYGRLAEILGARALPFDKQERAVDIGDIAERQLRAMTPRDRAAIVAFSDGINAAVQTQPLPVEFRMLLYRPARWSPKDTLAVSIVASLELADSWHNVFARDAVWRQRGARCFDAVFPLSDPRYDVTVDGIVRQAQPPVPARGCDEEIAARGNRPAIGSNAWAAGAARSAGGSAIVANDPHLDLTIPGIWYLVDIESPQLHAAGASIPGVPGVVLGHNERLAWASTNAEMATTSVFQAGRLDPRFWKLERFRVRFARDERVAFYRTKREFSVPNDNDPSAIALVRWPIYAQARSTIATVLALDRARSVNEGLEALAAYRGSPQNFILADRSGVVAYHVAGLVPNDPAWGRYVHRSRELRTNDAPIAFGRLPARPPNRDAILVSANNKSYGPSYPYRLSAQFEPPYRAFRIAQLLRARERYDVAYFASMQLDTLSPIDLRIARELVRLARAHPAGESASELIARLAGWDGRYQPGSRAAAFEHALREALFRGPAYGIPLDEDEMRGVLPFALRERRSWREVGGLQIQHPLAPMNFAFLNGAWLPGAGDEYTIHLQEPGFAQGFRAVWEVGDWDRGGISIPSGESGEAGSAHYTDLTRDWVAGVLQPLPFSRAAIRRNASSVLLLTPSVRSSGP
ncbi:MAG: penicillin acylase family protein [Candidatus Baltobacteraceae bacterium]